MKKRLIFTIILVMLVSLTVQAALEEDIINFNNKAVKVEKIQGRWKITSNNSWLLDFGSNRADAYQALQIIKHYRLNQICFVGRPDPSMKYFLSSGQPPVGPINGEDSIYFDNSKLKVRYINNRWKIMEGENHSLLDFDQNEDEAWKALRIIWKYDFNYICFVGRPNAPMVYFRK